MAAISVNPGRKISSEVDLRLRKHVDMKGHGKRQNMGSESQSRARTVKESE